MVGGKVGEISEGNVEEIMGIAEDGSRGIKRREVNKKGEIK